MLALVRTHRSRPHSAGFTLIELMVTLVIFALVAVTVTLVLQNSAKSKQRTTSRIESEQTARAAIDLMARDIRTAGYGADRDAAPPQPAIAYVDSNEIILSINQKPFPETGAPQPPLAYNPASTPRPRTIDGNAYAPPIRYNTGAELIRYTLDVDNNGTVDASDVAAPEGADAAGTPNPNDFVLVRQVYGDETGGVAGDNGGTTERVALIRRTGAGVPPIFNVYMRGASTPWDWSNGPVPQNQLANIQRIELQVTATASRPDSKGQYAQTTLKSQVNSMRSVPDFGAPTYVVSGYVFNDQNDNDVKDGTEPGIPSATVRLGSLVAYTNASGFYSLNAKAGTYQLSHVPAVGYGSAMTPDVFNVTITNTAYSFSFADTARHGGYVNVTAFDDQDGDGNRDAGEAGLQGIRFNISPGTPEMPTGVTDAAGNVSLFTGVGGYSVQCVPPDSTAVTTGNPQTAPPEPLMTDGGTVPLEFGLTKQYLGTISGKVYVDANRNGTLDSNDPGIAGVWVGASKDGGTNVAGYATTDGSGNFSIKAPVNDPPRTQPYAVYCVPPPGYFPTTSTSLGNVWVRQGQDTPNNNFGMANFQIIRLTANRVLSLAAADVIEQDWPGKRVNEARADQDLILGADAGTTDNISVWFNRYSNNPLFNATPTHPDGYSRLAPNSVLAMAVDTLDKNDNRLRPDLVTGTKYAVNGNFFVWFNQGSSNNEGYFPSSYSPSQNYLTADNGDVQSVLTMDVGGGSMPDIIVGSKSAVAGQGSVEIWVSDDATTPRFTRDETFNSIYSTILGEVNSMTLADIDRDGDRDLLVATRTSDYNGQMIVFENRGRTAGTRFIYRYAVSFGGITPTVVSCLDADGDGWQDIFVGCQQSTSQGRIYQFRNTGDVGGLFTFSIVRGISTPGIVMSMIPADLGGDPSRRDLAVGYRTSTSGYGGGLVIYYMDTGLIPSTGVDPSQGSIVNMVPALATANFNYGENTTAPPYPYLSDLAAGVKASATTGALVVFIR